MKQINLRLDEELLDEVDAARGLIGRNLFLVSLIRFGLRDRMGAVAGGGWGPAEIQAVAEALNAQDEAPPPEARRSPAPESKVERLEKARAVMGKPPLDRPIVQKRGK